MVSTSGRPEGDTTLVSGFGCSGVFGGACGFVVCVRALGWSDSVVSPPLCWVLGLGGLARFPPGRLVGGPDPRSSRTYDHMV